MKLISMFLLLSFCHVGNTQYDVKRNFDLITFKDGSIKSSVKSIEKKTKGIKLHEFYLYKEISRTDYYHNGSKKLAVTQKTKKGTYGKPCKEILFHQIDYYKNGNKKYEYKSNCDCHKEKKTYFNINGKITKIEKLKLKWIKPSK